MTKNKETNKKNNKRKKILYELVQESKKPLFIIIGALTKAKLLKQYEYEVKEYGRLDLKPSITENEFNKIIKNYEED